MKNRKIWFVASLLILIAASYLLITGSPLLVRPIVSGSKIPMGTFITGLGFLSLPSAIYLGTKRFHPPVTSMHQNFALLFKILIVLALLWIPVSYLLAGNLSFTFSEKATFQGGQTAMKIFWYNSGGLVVLPIILWMVYGVFSVFKKRKNKHS